MHHNRNESSCHPAAILSQVSEMSPIEAYDLTIPSLAIHVTLTKVPCGQWTHDFGTSGIMRLTYQGQANLAGILQWDLRMVVSEDSRWVVAKNDIDGSWFNGDGEPIQVTLVPTIWNLLKRVAALEGSLYDNVNTAIQAMQGTEKMLSERVAHTEEQRKSHADYVLKLVETQSQECLQAVNGVRKVDAVEKSLAELVEGNRAMGERAKEDIEKLNRDLATRCDAMEAKYQSEVVSIREKLFQTCVKKEITEDTTAEDIDLLKGTVGTCLRRDEELQQALDRLSNCFNVLQRDVGKLNAQVTPEVIVELSPDING